MGVGRDMSIKKKMSKRLIDVRKVKKDVRGFDETYYSAGEKDDIERELDEYEIYLMNRRKGLTNREIEVVMGMDRGYYKGENWQGTRNYDRTFKQTQSDAMYGRSFNPRSKRLM